MTTADFVRLKSDGQPVLVNTNMITAVMPLLKGYDTANKPIYSETETVICFAGDADNRITVDTSFKATCIILSHAW